jgi:hypothetical protein
LAELRTLVPALGLTAEEQAHYADDDACVVMCGVGGGAGGVLTAACVGDARLLRFLRARNHDVRAVRRLSVCPGIPLARRG